MKNASDELPGGQIGDFRGFVLGLLPDLGLTATTVTMESPHSIRVWTTGAGGETVLLEALQHRRKVGAHTLASLARETKEKGCAGGIFVSTSGFTPEAESYASAHGIRLVTPGQAGAPAAMEAKRPAAGTHNIFESVFASSMDEPQAAAFFEKQRRKPLFGLIGQEERVESIEGRFAPVGTFALRRPDGSGNSFFVNLGTCGLYYVYRGLRGNEVNLRSYEVLHRIMDLNPSSLRILSDAVEWQELNLSHLDPKYHGFLQENYNNVLLLQNRGLIGLSRDGGTLLSNVNLRNFRDERYGLGRFLQEGGQLESRNPVDAVSYDPHEVLRLLSGLFQAEGEFKGVTYLPYYSCRYASSGGIRTLTYDCVKKKD